MSFDTVKQIMEEAGSGYLATTDGDRAYVRPMGSPQWVGSELWMATGLNSGKVAQIKKRNRVEFCIADKAWRFLRIAGTCSISQDTTDRQTFMDRVPVITQYFSGATDANYAVLRIKVETMQLVTPQGETSVQPPR